MALALQIRDSRFQIDPSIDIILGTWLYFGGCRRRTKRRKREEGRGKREEGRGKREEGHLVRIRSVLRSVCCVQWIP